MDSDAYVYTFGMTDEEMDRALRRQDTAVLALADEGNPYAVPLTYHYDGESLWLRLSDDGDSEKMAFLDATTRPCLLVYGVDGSSSWSILMRGHLDAVEDDHEETMLLREFGSLRVFDEDIEDLTLRLYEFVVEEATARRTD